MISPLGELPSFDADGRVLAVIEASRGSRTKLKFEPALGVLMLNGVLPEGLAYPCDFGFIPSTLAEDGDPLDVMMLDEIQRFFVAHNEARGEHFEARRRGGPLQAARLLEKARRAAGKAP